MKRQDFEFLVDLLRRNAGWEFDEQQYFILDKKISNFIREKAYPSVEDLVAELKVGSRALIAQVVESMAFSDTSFCRDYEIFEQFQEVLDKVTAKGVIPNDGRTFHGATHLRLNLACPRSQVEECAKRMIEALA